MLNVSLQQPLTRAQARAIFRKHRGSITRLADEIDVSKVSVSQWLRGRLDSRRIGEAVLERAIELSTEESI